MNEFTMIIICNRCRSVECNIHFDAANQSFTLKCFHCGLEEIPILEDKDIPKNLNEQRLRVEKRNIKNELKKLKN